MPTETTSRPTTPQRLRVHNRRARHLGEWTTARHIDVAASGSLVVVDLLLPRIDDGDIEIHLDLNRTTVKLLVPEGAQIDDDDLRRIGRGAVKDRTGTPSPGGRRIRLTGEMRGSEVRVHRGGVAVLTLLCSGRAADVRRAHREGRLEPQVGQERGSR
jgi:hypothetical protein